MAERIFWLSSGRDSVFYFESAKIMVFFETTKDIGEFFLKLFFLEDLLVYVKYLS